MLAYINISSIRCKFDRLVYGVKGIVDVLMITETKLDDSFQTMQFNTEAYYTFTLDPNEYGGGILLYVRYDIPSKLISMKKATIEVFFIEFEKKRNGFFAVPITLTVFSFLII